MPKMYIKDLEFKKLLANQELNTVVGGATSGAEKIINKTSIKISTTDGLHSQNLDTVVVEEVATSHIEKIIDGTKIIVEVLNNALHCGRPGHPKKPPCLWGENV